MIDIELFIICGLNGRDKRWRRNLREPLTYWNFAARVFHPLDYMVVLILCLQSINRFKGVVF
jgi:hypothetical protein